MKRILAENLRAELGEMANRFATASLAEPMTECVGVVREGFDTNFNNQADSSGGSWPDRKDDKPHPLLRETGRLWAAATGNGSGAVEHVEPRSLQVGVDKGVDEGGLPGAAVHNFGYQPGNIPQREFVYANETTLDGCQVVIADGAYTEFFVF